MFQLRAPKGFFSGSIMGFPLTVVNGTVSVPTDELVSTLRSHGFKLVQGEDRAVMGSRRTMIERLVNDARYYAEKMTDQELISYASIAAGPGDGIDAVWEMFEGNLATLAKSKRKISDDAFEPPSTTRLGKRATGMKSKRRKALPPGEELPEKVDDMTRKQLFEFLKASGVAMAFGPKSNAQLREIAREVKSRSSQPVEAAA